MIVSVSAHAVEEKDADDEELVEAVLCVRDDGKQRRHFLWKTAPSKVSYH